MMQWRRGLLLILVLFSVRTTRGEESEVARELRAYYQQQSGLPKVVEALKNLSSDNADVGPTAAAYVIEVLERARLDEYSGNSFAPVPYFGGGGEHNAHTFRFVVARNIALKKATSATMRVAEWYLDHETDGDIQVMVLPLLKTASGPDAEKLCLGLIDPLHPNYEAVSAAIEQTGRLKVEIPDKVLSGLCQHHRRAVREAARKRNRELGRPDPAPFDPVAAIQSPRVAKLMEQMRTLLGPSPVDAPYVIMTQVQIVDGFDGLATNEYGWLTKNDDSGWEILSLGGRRLSFRGDQMDRERRIVGTTERCSWKPYGIVQDADRIEEIRTAGDPQDVISVNKHVEHGKPIKCGGVEEATLAACLYESKAFELSSRILFPCLELSPTDEQLLDVVRHHVGYDLGIRMLVAFVGDRNYQETERLANLIVERYPATQFHALANHMVNEIPRRRSDFQSLKLPTVEEWATLKKTLSRKEQIAYLAERFRLLNCFQYGQPGGYYIGEPQFAEPCGMSQDASFRKTWGQTKVINPYVELMGTWESTPEGKQVHSGGMDLTLNDILQLAEFLREDWHILCVSFWRDFHPSRKVGTTREQFGHIIDGLAKKNLCRIDAMHQMNPTEIDREIDRIQRWAVANATE